MHSAEGGQLTETFDAFTRRERASLVTFAWALTGSLPAAEELAQDALVSAWQQWDQIGGYDRPGSWRAERSPIAQRDITAKLGGNAGRSID